MWIDPNAIKADVMMFSPIINSAVSLVPGVAGNTLAALLRALENPAVLAAVVDAVNAATGAKSPS